MAAVVAAEDLRADDGCLGDDDDLQQVAEEDILIEQRQVRQPHWQRRRRKQLVCGGGEKDGHTVADAEGDVGSLSLGGQQKLKQATSNATELKRVPPAGATNQILKKELYVLGQQNTESPLGAFLQS